MGGSPKHESEIPEFPSLSGDTDGTADTDGGRFRLPVLRSDVVPARKNGIPIQDPVKQAQSDLIDYLPPEVDLHDPKVLRHEVANPVAAMYGAIALMRKTIEDHGTCPKSLELYRLIDIMEMSAQQIMGIIESLGKRPSSEHPATNPELNPHFRPIDLSSVLQNLFVFWQVLTETESVRFEQQIQDGIQVLGDSVKLYEVLSNIMANALEVLKSTSSPTILITLRKHPDILGLVQVFIRDNGPGVSEAAKSKLFTKGFSDKNGHGIGLWRSRRLVREMGGELTLVNNHERDDLEGHEHMPGATAVVELPVYEEPQQSFSAKKTGAEKPQG